MFRSLDGMSMACATHAQTTLLLMAMDDHVPASTTCSPWGAQWRP